MSAKMNPLTAGMIFRQYTLSDRIETGPIFDRWKVILTAQTPMRELLVFHTGDMPAYRADAILEELKKCLFFRTSDTLALYEAGKLEESGEVFLVRDLFTGKPLSELIQDRIPLPLEQAIIPVCRVLLLLNAAKQYEITHNSIAADNLFVGPTGEFKIAFLGMDPVFRLFDNAYHDYVMRKIALPGIPPERCGALMRTSHAGDIYSLGALLFRLLTGSSPFAGLTCDEIIRNILSGRTPDASQLNPRIHPDITHLLKSMMSKRPEDRPDDLLHLERELRRHACSESRDSTVLRELYQQTSATSASVLSPANWRNETIQTVSKSPLPGKKRRPFAFLILLCLLAGAGVYGVSTLLNRPIEEKAPVPLPPPVEEAPVPVPPKEVISEVKQPVVQKRKADAPKPKEKKIESKEKEIHFSKDKKSLFRFPPDYDKDSYVVPDGVSSISQDAFKSCKNLKVIVLPASLSNIGLNAFDGCDGLTEFLVSKENKFYASEKGVLFNREKETLLLYPKRKPDPFYAIPDSVHTIEPRAFAGAENLFSVTIARKIKEIPEEAFTRCSKLAKVNFSGAPGRIGDKAFRLCPELKSIVIPSSVSYIGKRAFADTGLESIIIRNEKAEIESDSFLRCPGANKIFKGF